MIEFTINTRPLDDLVADLKAAEGVILAGQRAELADITSDVAIDASLYPPEPPGSTYVRTYDLERGWGVEGPTGGGLSLEAAAVNSVEHARYVMGEDQAPIHAGRWRTAGKIAEQWTPQTAERLADRAVRDLTGAL